MTMEENVTKDVGQTDKKDELTELNEFLSEREKRVSSKIASRTKNKSVDALRLDENNLKKLDSSIKKVTSFIKRLKGLTESQKDALTKEMTQLNLSKYLSEVAAAFLEAKLKMNDVSCALHLCSLLHQHYADFAALLYEQWQKVLNLKKDEKVANPSKLRVDLRLFAELITIGVLPEKESLSLLGNQLTVLTMFDKDYSNISIISSFCKHCGEDFAGLVPTKFQQLAMKHDAKLVSIDIFSTERQKAVRNLFKDYFNSLCQHLLNEHKEIQRIERQNKKAYQTKGEIHSEKKEKYENSLTQFKKLLENTETLAELLGETLPSFPVEEVNKKDEDILNIDLYVPGKGDEFDTTTSPWEDEETRQFYEFLPDLKALVPAILYKDSEKPQTNSKQTSVEPASTTTATTVKEESVENMADEMAKIEKELQELEKQTNQEATQEQEEDLNQKILDEKEAIEEESIQTSGVQNMSSSASTNTLAAQNMKALIDSFINNLPNCVNRELIDKAANDFCMNLNTKLNRKKLITALFQVQRTRLDLLPFYARLVAILNPIMSEISSELTNLLLNDFRFHVRKKDQINIESKIKTARFIGELVKFQMFPKADAINCLKSLLADFKHHNIEMFCNLLDVCGRYLYRNQETHMKLKLLLEILTRKTQALSLDSRYTIMIDNAFYYCNPPENKQIEKKVLSPIHEYIKKLVYKDLNKLNVEKVLRLMRKFDWENEVLKRYIIKCLIAVWNVRYNSIHCVANLVSGLALYHDDVGLYIVDGILEDIRLGLEVNLPKYNQRRVSIVKYLGELYNYRMVESSIIFKTLYLLITFRVSYDLNEAKTNEFDPIDNFFRVRLVCVLLETCGQYFDRGSTKKKLDCFLVYFQRYFWFKRESSLGEDISKPFDTFDINFTYTETLNALRDNFKYVNSFKEACERCEQLEKEIKENLFKSHPHLLKEVNKSKQEDVLNMIMEEQAEEGEEIDGDQEENEYEGEMSADSNDEFDEEDDEKDTSKRLERRDSQNMDEEIMDDEVQSRRERSESLTQEQNVESNSDVEQEQTVNVQPKMKKQEVSQEDEDFMKAFDMLVSENIAQRTKETIKMPSVDISVPMIAKKIKTAPKNENIAYNLNELKGLTPVSSSASPAPKPTEIQTQKNKNFNFVVMTKKGNKIQYHNMEVPLSSEFASQFKAREEAEKAEKEKLKKLTLNINDRMEQEEFQEMIQNTVNQMKATFITNTNRDRHQKFSHQRGAPDADLIFGSSSVPNKRNT